MPAITNHDTPVSPQFITPHDTPLSPPSITPPTSLHPPTTTQPCTLHRMRGFFMPASHHFTTITHPFLSPCFWGVGGGFAPVLESGRRSMEPNRIDHPRGPGPGAEHATEQDVHAKSGSHKPRSHRRRNGTGPKGEQTSPVDPEPADPAMSAALPPSRLQAGRGTGYPVKSTRPAPRRPRAQRQQASDEGRIARIDRAGKGRRTPVNTTTGSGRIARFRELQDQSA